YTNFELVPIDKQKNIYEITLKKGQKDIEITKASSGEKEIINLLFGIFAFNVKRGIVIIDEPDLHLHPRWQRLLLELFNDLSEERKIQFLIVTHSPQFITTNSIKNTFRVYKENETSRVFIPKTEGMEKSDIKGIFQIVNVLNNEKIFFADKVVLLEGQSEQLLFNILIQEDLLNVVNTSIINVQSKYNIPLFVKVLNSLKIPYCVMLDEDPFYLPYFTNSNLKKIRDKQKHYRLNLTIADGIDKSLGKLVILSPDLEGFLGVSKNQYIKLGKPTAIYRKFDELRKQNSPKVNELIDLFKLLLQPENLAFDISKQDGTEWQPIDKRSISLPLSNLSIVKNVIRNQLKGFKTFLSNLTSSEKGELKSLFD
ncbi:hypothetical protein LCGC14_2393160, partial [marine sediment metagenome]